jgi:hypothetical protein
VIKHKTKAIKPYEGIFVGNRHVMPDGTLNKWCVNISVIFHYIKNEAQIFDFLFERENAKPELMGWLRDNLLKIKRENLSKFWKKMFARMAAKDSGDSGGMEITFEDIEK